MNHHELAMEYLRQSADGLTVKTPNIMQLYIGYAIAHALLAIDDNLTAWHQNEVADELVEGPEGGDGE